MDLRQIPKYSEFQFSPKQNDYCICVFVINEGEKLIRQLDSMSSYCNIVDIVVADGGSTDNSTNLELLKSNQA